MLTDIAKKVVKAPQRREAVAYLRSHYGVSERRACLVVGQPRSVQWYTARRLPQDALKRRIKDLAEVRVRYGYKRIDVFGMSGHMGTEHWLRESTRQCQQ